jgi:hypothetical protein
LYCLSFGHCIVCLLIYRSFGISKHFLGISCFVFRVRKDTKKLIRNRISKDTQCDDQNKKGQQGKTLLRKPGVNTGAPEMPGPLVKRADLLLEEIVFTPVLNTD